MGIAQQIDKDAKSATNAVAREAKKEIIQNALSSVQMFYEAYMSPDYERTWGLFTAYKTIDSGFGTAREVGVEFDASFIMTAHKISNEAVYSWSWEEGSHGNPSFPGTVTTASPKAFMDQRFQHTLSRMPGIIQRNFSKYFS